MECFIVGFFCGVFFVFLNVEIPCVVTKTHLVDLVPIHTPPKKKSNQL